MAHEHEQERSDSPQGAIVPGGNDAESLRRANAVLGGLIEGSRDLMAVQDTEFHFIAFNRGYQAEFKEVYGVQLKAGDSLLTLLAHLPEESRTAREFWARTLRGEEFTETIEFGDPALGRRSYEIQSFPIRDPAGLLIGGAHIARDVTVRGRAEEALRASEENFRRIIDSSTDCIKVIDLEGRMLSINPCGQRLMEIEDPTHFIGRFWLDTWDDEGRQLAAEAMERARNGEIGHFCALSRTVQGSPKWWDETVSPILDAAGRPERLLVIANDITQRKQTEDELRRSEAEFRTFFESSGGGKAQADPSGRFLRVNGKLCEMTGYSCEELLGMTIADVIHPEDRERQMELFRQARDSEAAEYSVEKRYLRKDGAVVWVQATVGFLRDETGNACRSLAVIQDITPLKRTEQELRASEERFRRLIETSTVGLAIVDAGGCICYANPMLLEMLGYALEDVCHLHCGDFIPPEFSARHASAVEEVLATGVSEPYEKELIAKDGRRVPVLDGAALISKDPDGHPLIAFFITDLTRLKQAEAERERLLGEKTMALEQLEIERQKLQAIIQHMPAGVIMTDAATEQRILINEAAAEILGATLEPGSPTGEMAHQLLKADGQPYAYAEYPIVRTLRTGEIVRDEEIRIVRPDGEQRSILTNSVPIRDAEGRIVSGVVLFREITERKRAEEALHESEAFLRMVLHHLPAGVSIVDAATQQYRIVNAQAERILGEPIPVGAPLQGVTQFLTFQPDRTPYPLEDWPVLRAIRDCQVITNEEMFILRGDGTCRTILVNAAPLMNSGPHVKAGIVVFADISERKRMERELRQSEEFTHSVLNSMPAHVVVLDQDGTIIEVNEAWTSFARENGAPDPERAYRGENYLEVCRRAAASELPGGEGAQECLEKLQALMKGAIDQFDLEYPCHAPGEQRWFLLRATPVTGGEGRVVISHIDITERKQAEAALMNADRRKDEFLAMMAHELRNPLAPIRNAVQVLRLAATQEGVLERQRDIIERQVTHMARLLDDLLDVARITRGNTTLKKSVVRLSDVFVRAVESANPLIESRRHTLRVSSPPEGLRVYGDFDRLIQIVSNLLTNAAKYTEEGGTIWLDAATEGPEVVIRVRDTGVGIAPAMLPRVFDVFTQVTRTLDRSQGGLGLGLTLVRRLTQMHGGSVDARSAGLGQGSEFIVRLPALPAEPTSGSQQEGTLVQAQTHPHRILVVDDVADTANSLAELLGLFDHEVRTAYDGPAVIQIAREFEPDVIILDIGLPGEDGYEVARKIRQDAKLQGVILIAMTGYGQEEDRRRAQQAGFDHLFTKPVELGALQSLLA